jgi:hypothetical protein
MYVYTPTALPLDKQAIERAEEGLKSAAVRITRRRQELTRSLLSSPTGYHCRLGAASFERCIERCGLSANERLRTHRNTVSVSASVSGSGGEALS